MSRLWALDSRLWAPVSWLWDIALFVAWPQPVQSHGSLTTTVLFDREIVRILDQRCVMCHMDKGLSFPLETYEQTWLQGRAMRASVLRRHMPPWSAVAGYGEFVNDNRLTLRESQFVVSWVEGLGPRNGGKVFLNVVDPNAAATREIRATPHTDHWQLGEPDLLRPLQPIAIEAKATDTTKRVVVDLGLTCDAPGARARVHAWRSSRRACGDVQPRKHGTVARKLDTVASAS